MLSGSLPWKMPVITSSTQSLQLNFPQHGLARPLLYDNIIALFDNLKVLHVSGNHLTGQLPTFHFVDALEVVWLSNNQFPSFIRFSPLARDSSVSSKLDLSRNKFSCLTYIALHLMVHK